MISLLKFSKLEKKISHVKSGYSERTTEFEKIFHLKFDVTQYRQILSGRFFQILWSFQNIRTLPIRITVILIEKVIENRKFRIREKHVINTYL